MHYRERLYVPFSWWLSAAAFAITCGWIILVATGPTAAIATSTIVGVCLALLLVQYGGSTILVEDELRVANAHMDLRYCGEPEVLDAQEFRAVLGPRADARAYIFTRPFLRYGVLIPVVDDRDLTPYWLIASRSPDALAAAIGQTENEPTD